MTNANTTGHSGPEDALIEPASFARGSPDWLRHVVLSHAAYLGRALRYLGVPDRDVPDACQEVFVIASRKHAELSSDAKLRSWLYGIAINVARNARRSRSRHPERLVAEPPDASSGSNPEIALARQQRRDTLQRLLGTLTDEQREVVVLHDIEERPMREIAELLGVPLFTGYSRLRLGRAALSRAASEVRDG